MFRRNVIASLVAVLAGLALVTEVFHSPFAGAGEAQQATITSTRGIVVIAIPGFPVESILIGLLLGLAMLIMIHRHRTKTSLD
jgi:predicted benzoate:H+ symporter BenE